MENCFWVKSVLNLDDQPQTVNTVSEVLNCRDALQTTGRNIFFDLLNDLFGSDHVGELSDDKAHLSCGNTFNLDLCASLECPAACFTGVLNALQADDDAAFRKIRTGHITHEICNGGIGML